MSQVEQAAELPSCGSSTLLVQEQIGARWQVAGSEFSRTAGEEILAYVVREMRSPRPLPCQRGAFQTHHHPVR